MDYFIKKENYKGKKLDLSPFTMGLQLLKGSKCGQFPLFYFIMTSLYITLSVRNRCVLIYHTTWPDGTVKSRVFFL